MYNKCFQSHSVELLRLFFFLLIVSLEFLQKLCLRFHYIRSVTPAFRTEPFAFRFCAERDTREMEPLDRAQIVVAEDHFTIRNLVAETISRFVRIDCQVVLLRRWGILSVLVLMVSLSCFSLLLFALSGSGVFLLVAVGVVGDSAGPRFWYHNHVHGMSWFYQSFHPCSSCAFCLSGVRIVRIVRTC